MYTCSEGNERDEKEAAFILLDAAEFAQKRGNPITQRGSLTYLIIPGDRLYPMWESHSPIRLESSQPLQLLVVVDAEAEFDWNSGPMRSATAVSSMRQIHRVQAIFDAYAIKPCYAVDYPVADQLEGREQLVDFFRSGRCEIGAHAHPWVNPPHLEDINSHNSFIGNLPRDLEFRKVAALRDLITTHFGITPTIYKAGRYGIGPNTPGILRQLGFDIDLSLCPAFDYRTEGGPDFSQCRPDPFWFGPQDRLLEIPVTGAFVGWAGPWSPVIYRHAEKFNALKARAILARLGAIDRLMLSPEGYRFDEHVKLTRHLIQQGVRTFTWNFHSPSLVPGFTPYVNNPRELETFLDAFKRYFDFFFGELGGVATSPLRLWQQLINLR